jgi:hypothetical protein
MPEVIMMINSEGIKTMYRNDFCSFVHMAFNILNPHIEYQHNWHIELLADHLQKVARGDITRLIINVPPRMLKSHCASIALPAYILGRDPRKKILCLNGSMALEQDLHDTCYSLMKSTRYQQVFEQTSVSEANKKISTNHGGYKLTMGMTANLTGMGADIVIIDDPLSTYQADDKTARNKVNTQFDSNVLQRLNCKKTGAIIVVMQRLHENDLTGHILSNQDGWTHLNLPAVALQDEEWQTSYGKIIRRKKQEVLHPERASREQLASDLIRIGGKTFAMQYLQNQYKTRFGAQGHGCIVIHPMREGKFFDARKEHQTMGFYKFTEAQLMLHPVLGIGEPCVPENMRSKLTYEEFMLKMEVTKEAQMKLIEEQEKKLTQFSGPIEIYPQSEMLTPP